MVLFYIAKTSFHLLRHNNNNSSSENTRLIDNTNHHRDWSTQRQIQYCSGLPIYFQYITEGRKYTGGEM